jgi:hypothetical protein
MPSDSTAASRETRERDSSSLEVIEPGCSQHPIAIVDGEYVPDDQPLADRKGVVDTQVHLNAATGTTSRVQRCHENPVVVYE